MKLLVPYIEAGIDYVTINGWIINEGETIEASQSVVLLETMKAIFELESEYSGILYKIIHKEGKKIPVLKPIAIIKTSDEIYKKDEELIVNEKEVESILSSSPKDVLPTDDEVKKTEVIPQNSIDQIIELKGNRQFGKEQILESFNTIPHSYIEKAVIVDNWESKREDFIRKKGKLLTLLSLIIVGLAQALKKHRVFNAYRENERVLIYKDVNIGVVIDYEESIAVPVIKDADKLEPIDIVKNLMKMRKDLIEHKTKLNDLIGGTFTVSALNHMDVSRFIPIIHPKQAAVLAIPKIQINCIIDEMKEVKHKRILNLGLSFDHTFLDAKQAINFLNTVVKEVDNIVISL